MFRALQTGEQAFSGVYELPYGEKKKLVVIDEFPYLCKTNPSIPSILQNLWDTELKDRNHDDSVRKR